jgi:hypothetical protein
VWKAQLADACQFLDDDRVRLEKVLDRHEASDLNWRYRLLFHPCLFAHGTHGHDQALHHLHLGHSSGIDSGTVGDGIVRQRNGLRGRFVVIERVPNLFGQEGHEGRKQT